MIRREDIITELANRGYNLERVLNFPFTWSAKYDPDLDQYYAESTIHKSVMDKDGVHQ